MPLYGLYRVQLVENGIPHEGPGLLMTKDRFSEGFIEHGEPYFQYGVTYLPRHNDVVTQGSLENARAALAGAPILVASGDYGIVRRLLHEPGNWESVQD